MSTRAASAAEVSLALAIATRRQAERLELERPRWNPRDSQRTPAGAWRTWLIRAGRGWGKTRVGAEEILWRAQSGLYKRMAIVAPTAADARDVCVEGESGIMEVASPLFRPRYEPSRRRIVFPNGAKAYLYSADEPDRLRGPQHDFAWCDELAAWRRLVSAWDNLMMGLRLGDNPQCVITTTPRPIKLIRELRERSNTVETVGSTYENIANLSKAFIEETIKPYEGTRQGRQELHAEILDDVEGALWKQSDIDACRIDELPDILRGVVGVDPSGGAAEIGIVSAGKLSPDEYLVIADDSLVASPERWAATVLEAFDTWSLDAITAEANFGGDMVRSTIQAKRRSAPVRMVTASRGKRVRAEPVSLLSEAHRLYFYGHFPKLETELTTFVGNVPGEASPNRLDAMVWAVTDLQGKVKKQVRPA